MDIMVFSLIVFMLVLKMFNGLDGMFFFLFGVRVFFYYLEIELEDLFVFNEEDDDLKKGVIVRKKL